MIEAIEIHINAGPIVQDNRDGRPYIEPKYSRVSQIWLTALGHLDEDGIRDKLLITIGRDLLAIFARAKEDLNNGPTGNN